MGVGDRTTLRSLYLYVVCLVTLIIVIFSTVSVVRNAVQLLYPDPGYAGFASPAQPANQGFPTGQAQALQNRQQQASQRHEAVLGLVGSGALLVLAGPIYFFHWRRVKLELPSREAGPGSTPTSAEA